MTITAYSKFNYTYMFYKPVNTSTTSTTEPLMPFTTNHPVNITRTRTTKPLTPITTNQPVNTTTTMIQRMLHVNEWETNTALMRFPKYRPTL